MLFSNINFPLSTVLAKIPFSFSFNLFFFLNFPWDLLLIHEFRKVLFSFQVLGDFPVMLLLLISSLILLWSKNILCLISVILNCRSWFWGPMTWYVLIYILMGTWKQKCILLVLGGVLYRLITCLLMVL